MRVFNQDANQAVQEVLFTVLLLANQSHRERVLSNRHVIQMPLQAVFPLNNMLRRCSVLRELLSNRPHVEKLWEFVDRVLKQKGDEIEFIVLYGSMAKGNWSVGSDYDVLIGLCIDDGKRFIDRLYDYSLLTSAPIDIFAYSQSELDLMFKNLHLTLLESLNHGIVLFDRGRWAEMQKQFKEWKTSGVIEQIPVGWRVKREQGNIKDN